MTLRPLLILASSLFLFSCESKEEVKWSSLSELDSLSIAVEQAASAHEHDTQKKLLKEAKTLISQVTTSLPENAQNKEEVNVLLQDLSSLSTQLDKTDTLDHGELDALSKAIHPLVAQLMTTSGVPHVHAAEPETGGDHSSHDHDHDHNH